METERTTVRERLSRRRLIGLDRSGPSPAATKAGAPLHPWTLPEHRRLPATGGHPGLPRVALGSEDGRVTGATLLYLFITLGDLLDGFLARATGQYSRMGALLDPSSTAWRRSPAWSCAGSSSSCPTGRSSRWPSARWPRWCSRAWRSRSGVDLEISWIGRLSTLFTFGGLFWTLVFDSWITVAMFIIGVTLGWIATILYTRASRRFLAEQAQADAGDREQHPEPFPERSSST